MKNKGLKQAAAVSAIAVLTGVIIQILISLYGRGLISGSGLFACLSAQYSFFQRSLIVWAVMIISFMLFTDKLSTGEAAVFYLAIRIGFAVLSCLAGGLSIRGWLPMTQSFGPYAYPVIFIGTLYWSAAKKDIFSGGLSLLWLALDLILLPVCVGLKDSGGMASGTIKTIHDAVFICAPVFMLAMAVRPKAKGSD